MTTDHQTVQLDLRPVQPGDEATIAWLSLARPEAANAFNSQMIQDITAAVQTVAATATCRAMIIQGHGKHFSAGADLAWMKASAKYSFDDNVKDASQLIDMFEAVYNLDIPTIAAVQGATFGGGLGLIAACDIAIAADNARFCLSEVKLGLIPAVIFPYLARKMQPGALQHYALTGKLFSAPEARDAGLVSLVCGHDQLRAAAHDQLNLLLAAAPKAQSALKQLRRQLQQSGFQQSALTAEAIARARTSAEGQAGLQAFFDKQPPPWVKTIETGLD